MKLHELELVIMEPARQDIVQILARSTERFGEAAADRYLTLLEAAMRDVIADPERPGRRMRPELAKDISTYHVALSRQRVTGVRVTTPRHVLVYRVVSSRLEVLRVLHDASELQRHLPEGYEENDPEK